MEKRLLVFLFLSAMVFFVWGKLFPPPEPSPVTADPAAAPAPAPPPVAVPDAALPDDGPAAASPAMDAPERVVRARSPIYEYRFTTRGGGLAAAGMLRYESYVNKGMAVQLVPASAGRVLAHRVVVGADTLDFRHVPFQPSHGAIALPADSEPRQLRMTSAPVRGVRLELTYTLRPDDYRIGVEGRVLGLTAPATLLTELGNGLASHDAPDHGSEREMSVVGWNTQRIAQVPLRKVRTADTIPGPLVWAGIKDRYFLIALINEGSGRFGRVIATDAPNVRFESNGDTRFASRATTVTELPLGSDGAFHLEAYVGPQEHDRLAAVGHELTEVNPYGYRWLRPVVRPIAAAILWTLQQLHDTLGIAYGWVLVTFGFMVRILTWPLNAKAMRAQMKNMAVQPQLQARMKEIQEKYREDPRRQQQEIMAMYKELGVSPFSMMSGCLPLLIPMPVLITLFFVFQSAIEFRGTSWGWLPDLSLRDPWHLLPVFLVVSMFGLQWISMRMSGMEQNQQMKMMMYMMPLVMGGVFWIMPAGLNLYYAATNVASFPQQILIARERRRAMEAQKAKEAAEKKAAKRSPHGKAKGGSGPARVRGGRRRG